MPATYQGNKNNNTSAAVWQASHAYSLGAKISPSPANGLIIVATQAGTSGSSQPAFNTPPFGTIGTTFTDGGVIWTLIGTEPGHWAPIIQMGVDADPPLAYNYVLALQTQADQIAWVTANAGFLAINNTWTGTNLFRGTSLTPLVTIEQLGTGVALELDGGSTATNPTLTVAGGNDQSGGSFTGGVNGGYAVIGQALGANFVGIRGIGDGSGAGVEGASVSGPGGSFTGGASGGDGVVGVGGLNGVGGRFTGDPSGAFADGVVGIGGVGGGIGGSFTGGAAGGAGVHGVGTGGFAGVTGQGDAIGLGPGGAFFSSSRHGAVYFQPMAGYPSTPNEGEMTYNLSIHKAAIWDGSTWQVLW